ncbi:MAG: superoxide dismutase family protein [Thermoanaerobaculales bacterium]
MNRHLAGLCAFSTALGLSVASSALAQQPASGAPRIVKAVATVRPTAGNRAAGTVTFTQESGGVHAVADITGLKPNAKHGFHVHEFGDCSAPDATSAGGHFNPAGTTHGAPTDPKHHAGDFGNLQADADGQAHLDLTMAGISLEPGPTSIVGRGVIVHLMEDDLKTQPTGNAGARIGCGAIGIAKDGITK